ncbi:MAG: hypothetical protein KDA58_08150, partial [Planctomycetaceae bacterium]|nr:hypothetical protein [Planctomycetaceae bacterium]
SAALCLVTAWATLSRSRQDRRHKVAAYEIATVTFAPDDLRRQSMLVCEMERLFDDKLELIHQRDGDVQLEFCETSRSNTRSRHVIFKLVLLEQTAAAEWELKQADEFIAGVDQVLELPSFTEAPAQLWTHLLPDDSLWVELSLPLQAGGQVARCTPCRLNEPHELWTGMQHGRAQRLLLVFELLSPCAGELS